MAAELAVLLERPSPEATRTGHDDAAERVDGDERAELQAIVAHRGDAAETALQASRLGPAAGPRIAEHEPVRPARRLRSRESGAREIAIGRRAAPGLGAAIEQIEKNGARNDRHARRVDGKADAARAKLGSDRAGGIEPIGGA